MSALSLLVWTSAAVSHQGNVRKLNEDAYLDLPELGLWTVADGMGGHQAGDVASQTIVEALSKIEEPANLDMFIDQVTKIVQDSNRQLRQLAKQQFQDQIIGSTIVNMLAYGDQCAFAWAGDSRVYRRRQGELTLLTRDHTFLEEYIDQGISRMEAEKLPESKVLTRAVGAEDNLQIDTVVDELIDGDCYILCSDGLYKELTEDEILAHAANDHYDSKQIAQQMVEQALSRQGRDNITVIVVKIKDALMENGED